MEKKKNILMSNETHYEVLLKCMVVVFKWYFLF